MAGTEYLCFQETTETGTWTIVVPQGEGRSTYIAASGEAAKQAAALEHGDGTYAATPARSWQPAAFKVQPRAVAVKPA